MEIYKLDDIHERKKAISLCGNLIEKHALVPVIGAGFSFETQTDNGGAIPSSASLRDELFSYIAKYSGYSKDELDEISKSTLPEIAKDFWVIYNRFPEKALRSFDSYIQTNFQDISFQKEYQKAFLDIRWPQLFSLNYDTLIENYSQNYYPIIPFDDINRRFYEEKLKLYKLHGDAKKFLMTGNKRYLVLSRDQYVESMMATENEDMLNELLTAFTSKSILFFGCGLTDELDLLYTSQLSIKEKVNSIDPEHQAIIYISYEKDELIDHPFPARKIDMLSQYGVTHLLRISSEEQSTEFFHELSKIAATVTEPNISSYLEKYSSIRFEIKSPNDVNSRDFLFQENLVWKCFNRHLVTLPGYHIRRTKLNEIIDCIRNKEPLCFISGNFYCGKSFVLLEAARHFSTKKVYLFPSGTRITEAQLGVLLEKKDTLFFFDARSLTATQIKYISREPLLKKISENCCCFIIVIEATDAPMYKYIFESKEALRNFAQFRISGVLNSTEEPEFNKKIGIISLPPYSKGETILDYIVHNEKELIRRKPEEEYFLEPQKDLLAKNQKKRIKALIMLATEIRISANRAILFKIDTAINEIIANYKKISNAAIIEKDYSVYSGSSSGFEFVCNSKYWIIRSLSAFVKTQADEINVIAEAYSSIIDDYRQIYKDDDIKFYQSCEQYYFFDDVNVLFNHHWFQNSATLVSAIYDKLLPRLSNSFQFLHQKAKGKLIIAQKQINSGFTPEGKKNLEEAVANISRAIRLAEMYPEAKYIDETLLHMKYTKARILVEFSCISLYRVPQAVDACYDLYESQTSLRHDVYDFIKSTGDDKRSFDKFKNILICNKTIRRFQDLDKAKTESLLNRWIGKKVF